MKRIFVLLFAVLISFSTVNTQEISREQKIQELRIISSQVEQTEAKLTELINRQHNIIDEIFDVSPQDFAESISIGAEAKRFFPAGMLKSLLSSSFEDNWSYSSYVLMPGGASYQPPRIEYQNTSLEFKDGGEVFGFIVNLGGTLIEMINEQNREFIALSKYKLPEKLNNTENEFSFDDVYFRKKVPVVVGNTYLVRAIRSKRGDDKILAIKIHRKDSDGSIVLFVKQMKEPFRILETNSQQLTPVADYAAQQAVTNALIENGFYNVTVEATTTEITIRGTIPKGKMAEMVQIAQETAKRKITNQVTENR